MSGTKKNRTDLENRFKKGMYPTENDFANVFASYVHKDDAITLSQITLEEGGDNLGEVIDSKADKQTLETFVREVETVLETTRDSETGAITNSAISSLAQRITDAENDIASAANAVETNEDSIAKILTILGKQNGESVSELASRFSALSGDYATVFAFVSKVKTFLESADVADTTINRWQEIEAFLQGITDTETLTGLLQQMKQEILAEIPTPQSGNFIEYTTDLDAITDAPNGKIMQYWGQSNDKYKRGQFYERVEKEIQSNYFSLVLNGTLTPEIDMSDRIFLKTDKVYKYHLLFSYVVCTGGERMPAVGDTVIDWNANTVTTIVSIENNFVQFADGRSCPLQNQIVSLPIFENTEEKEILSEQGYAEDSFMNNPQTYTGTDNCKFMLINGDSIIPFQSESVRVGSAMGLSYKEWQHIHVDEVIN